MIIETGMLKRGRMAGEVCIVTGAGRGIGLETARSLAWLGAKVVIAEIDRDSGKRAEALLNREFGDSSAYFVPTDVSDEGSVGALRDEAQKTFGHVDIIINNATAFRMGAVTDVAIAGWDLAYGVNVRGPVLMAQAFLPGMIGRDHGCFICVSSSGAAPFMGAYEVFKTAQVELARVLDAEMEGKNVHVLTIGPGMVRTPGSEAGIAVLAPLYHKSEEEFFAMSKDVTLTPEQAGAGFRRGRRPRGTVPRAGDQLVRRPERRWHHGGAANGSEGDADRAAVVGGRDAGRPGTVRSGRPAQGMDGDGSVQAAVDTAGLQEGRRDAVEQWLEALRALQAAIAARDVSRIAPRPLPLDRLAAQYAHMLGHAGRLREGPPEAERRKNGHTVLDKGHRGPAGGPLAAMA